MRLGSLVRDGKLYLSLHDAIDLALENNLDLVIARYNLPIAQMDILRTQAGGQVRGVNTGVVQGTPGGGQGASGAGGGAGARRGARAARVRARQALSPQRWEPAPRFPATIPFFPCKAASTATEAHAAMRPWLLRTVFLRIATHWRRWRASTLAAEYLMPQLATWSAQRLRLERQRPVPKSLSMDNRCQRQRKATG